MAVIKPFCALRPVTKMAKAVASVPYDVVDRQEAKELSQGNPVSFLHVVRSDMDVDSENPYAGEVYEKAKENLIKFENNGVLQQDKKPGFYIYRQVMDGRVQTGLVALCSIDEYNNGAIVRHELTRDVKVEDRIKHFQSVQAMTGPVFITYPHHHDVDELLNEWIRRYKPEMDFISEDLVHHYVWPVMDKKVVKKLEEYFTQVKSMYIADGHHRAQSASQTGNPYFLTILYSDEDVFILPYNRVIKDLNGHNKEDFLTKVGEKFAVKKTKKRSPLKKGEVKMFIDGEEYLLTIPEKLYGKTEIEKLDVSVLHKEIVEPLLGIKEVQTDERIDFVGGSDGQQRLIEKMKDGFQIGFLLAPVTIEDLMSVSDAGYLMPPKSTWFEPKPRSGLFIYKYKS